METKRETICCLILHHLYSPVVYNNNILCTFLAKQRRNKKIVCVDDITGSKHSSR